MATQTTPTTNMVSVSLPPSTAIGFLALTNAAYEQRITVQIGTSSPIVFSGSGENNHLIGQKNLTTPSGAAAVACTIKIEHNAGGSWVPSSVSLGSYVTANLRSLGFVVASEDASDNDYNDAMLWITFAAK